jgi:hypothetical protein
MPRQRTIERAWRRRLEKQARRRASMPPPAPGSLSEGDICPCGCGGVMTDVAGTLTALTLDFAEGDPDALLPDEGVLDFVFEVA